MSDSKIVFIHIPRTAGTMTSRIIRSNYNKEEIWITRTNTFGAYRIVTRQDPLSWRAGTIKPSLKVIAGHHIIHAFDVDKLKSEGWKFIACVRDPIERTISHYQWLKENHKLRGIVKEIFADLGVVDFTEMAENHQVSFNGEDSSVYDYIIRQEHYDEDIKRMCNGLGLSLKNVKVKVVKAREYIPVTHMEIDKETREKMMPYLEKDYKFYQEVMRRYK
jgi:hypothetical protein